MHLAIGSGNTNASLGVYDEMVPYWRLTTCALRTVDELGVD